jgi:hypothetical protein
MPFRFLFNAFLLEDSDILVAKSDPAYTAYVVQKTTGLLMGTSVGADIYSGTAFIQAIASTNDIIKTSYQYLLNNGLLSDIETSTTYTSGGVTSTMNIFRSTFKDTTQSLEVDVVYVSLTAITSAPTAMPTAASATVIESGNSGDDDYSRATADGAIASAVFAAFIFIAIVVIAVLFFTGYIGGGSKNSSEKQQTKTTEMKSINSAPRSDATSSIDNIDKASEEA